MRILKMFNGFVTNSSSVNFLIASKDKLTQEELEWRLEALFENKAFGKRAAELLWGRISYQYTWEEVNDKPQEINFYENIWGLHSSNGPFKLQEVKPYIHFYEVTLDQGPFNYYPGVLGDEGLHYQGWFDYYGDYSGISMRPDDMYGLLIDESNFKLCVGFLPDEFASIQEQRRRDIITEIRKLTGKTRKRIRVLVNEKKNELKDMISEEDVLFLVARDLGIEFVDTEVIPDEEVDYPAEIDLSDLLKVSDLKEKIYLIIERFSSEGNGVSFNKLKEILKISSQISIYILSKYIGELAMDSLIYHYKKNVFKILDNSPL